MIPLSSPISSPLCLICVSFFLSEFFLETLHVIATFLPESLATACRVRRRFLSLVFEILQSWSSSASRPPPLVQPTRPVPSGVLCLFPCVCPAEAALRAPRWGRLGPASRGPWLCTRAFTDFSVPSTLPGHLDGLALPFSSERW